jgi:hypothetical protein
MRLRAAVLAALAACYVGPPRYYQPPPDRAPPARPSAPPPPGAPAARMLTEQEAVNVAAGYARSQGVGASRLKHAHLDGAGRWHVELRGDRGRDKAKVLLDGWTGRVLRASFKDDDRDWDD